MPSQNNWNILKTQCEQRGAVIYSSQLTGWVPVSQCETQGNLNSSTFTISNLRIYGKLKQGPETRKF